MTTVTADDLIHRLKGLAQPEQRAGMARYGIETGHALGVTMPNIRTVAKGHKRNQILAEALWRSRVHEARILATIVADPSQITSETADQWAGDFQSWDLCDQACLNLMHRVPYAWDKIRLWSADDREFVRRAGFALLAVMAVHDKRASDELFMACFDTIEEFAGDDRNFVRKAVNWALRQIGKRNPGLNQAAIDCARRLANRPEKSARWIAHDALRELSSSKTKARLERTARHARL